MGEARRSRAAIGSGQSAVGAHARCLICVSRDNATGVVAEIGAMLTALPPERFSAAEAMFLSVARATISSLSVETIGNVCTLVITSAPSARLLMFREWLRREARRCARAVDPTIAPSPDCPLPTADCPPGEARLAYSPAAEPRAPP